MTILPLTYLGGIEWFTRLFEGERGDGVEGGGGCMGDGAVIDLGENWVKQTARNRCEIMTPGGPAILTVPVHGGTGRVRGWVSDGLGGYCGLGGPAGFCGGPADGRAAGGGRLRTRDVRIDNTRRWQHTHWLSMVSGYRNSPFFEHYQERFAPIYGRKFDFLIDLNLELLGVLLPALGFDSGVQLSENYVVANPGDLDLRSKKALRRPVDAVAAKNKTTDDSGGAGGDTADDLVQQVAEYQEYTQVFSDRIAFVPGLSIVDLLFCEGPGAREIVMRGGRLAIP